MRLLFIALCAIVLIVFGAGDQASSQTHIDVSVLDQTGRELCREDLCFKAPRIHLVAIFGENNLDDAPLGELEFAESYPNNCALFRSTGARTPSTGRIATVTSSGEKLYLGTGETIVRKDVVISAAHIVAVGGRTSLKTNEQLVFEIYEPHGSECQIATYDIDKYHVLTSDPDIPKCAHLDVAFFHLTNSIQAYEPLELGSEEIVSEFRAGRITAQKFGFANHKSVHFGSDWSIVTARAIPLVRHDPSCQNPNLFGHDGDAWSGESGAAFRIDGKLVGLHLRGYDAEYESYSNTRANVGAFVIPDWRRELEGFINSLDAAGVHRNPDPTGSDQASPASTEDRVGRP